MRLYTMPGACSLAGHIVLEWAGLPYELEIVTREQIKQPAFLALNPVGSVPVLTEGDWSLTQNAAILEYIAEQAPESGLLGDGSARSRAEVRRWVGFINSDVHKTFGAIFGAQSLVASDDAQAELRANSAKKLVTLFGILDKQLDGSPYLAGSAPSIADAYLFVVLRWARAKEIAIGSMSNLSTFFDRMRADEHVKAAMKAEGLE
ncbi:glutathione S-transferase family protein [Schauerella aestuarii]|uniref:glutathione S-transferase family protein n=1 Tax=Schauerella aestuarii TaxID=2511204 RepID=UPI00136B0B7A|nr:glutathione S-transferase N-terminal domain-containing protein [Achromobacter aestuarii]MYZ44525.1 glutathione S-transferase family protein [Achromobacter aestuarii]